MTIVLNQTAKIFNDTTPEIVIDGGGLVALSLTVQNLTFVDASSIGEVDDEGVAQGGGAIFARGGRLKIVNSRFFRNRCDDVGPDVGGASVRAFDQYQDLPIYVVHSTFGGAEGYGANPAREGTPGGGSGGAIYNDGNTFTLTLDGVLTENNHANEGGGAIFFVSNDRSGTLVIRNSVLRNNPSDGFETEGYPGIFVLANGDPIVESSTIE